MSIAVIIPAVGQIHYLGRCLDSVIHQLNAGDQVVVAFEGDEWAEFTKFQWFYNRRWQLVQAPIYTRSEPGERWGPSEARNRAVAALPRTWGPADCDWLKFLDADDVLAPFALESFRQMTQIPEEIQVVAGLMHKVVDGRIAPGIFCPNWASITEANPALVSGCFVRRTAFEAVGGFDERIHFEEDWDFWLKIRRHYPGRAFGLTQWPVCFYWIDQAERAAKQRDHSVEHEGERLDVREYFRRHYGITPRA